VRERVKQGLRFPLTLLSTAGTLWSQSSVWTRSLLTATVGYGCVFSVLTVLRVYALDARAYDLGNYNQAFYTTVFNHRLFFYTAGLPSNPSGSIFGVHFSPILFLLLIPYALIPSPITLTVLQTWVIALGALPLYALGRRALHSDRTAFVLSAVYLLHPATQGLNWYDFHPESFLPLAILSGLYFLERKKWKSFVLCMGLALSTIEMASFLVAALAVGSLIASMMSKRESRLPIDRKEVRMLLFTLGLAVIWLFLGRAVELGLNPRNIYYAGGSGYWSLLGAQGLLDIPIRLGVNPLQAYAALAYDAPLKAWYVLALFGPVLFLPIRSPRALFFCAPWMTVSLLSNNPPFYRLGDQYPAFVLPFVFYGATLGMSRPWRNRAGSRVLFQALFRKMASLSMRKVLPLPLLTTTTAFLVIVSPLGPVAFETYRAGTFPSIGNHERAVDALYNLIPRSASVLTQDNLFPLVSNRPNSFVVPLYTLHPPGTSFNSTMNALVDSVDYVLIDYQTRSNEAAVIYDWISRSDGFAVIGAGDGAVLLERGVSSLKFFAPYLRTFDDSTVIVGSGARVADPRAEDGMALLHSPSETSNFWFGPYAQLSPGVYEVSYRLRIDSPGAGTILELAVILWPMGLVGRVVEFPTVGTRTEFDLRLLSERVLMTNLKLNSTHVPSSGEYFWVAQSFVATALGLYEFPGLTGVGSMGLWFDEVRVQQLAAFGSSEVPTSWFFLDHPAN
jgi:uncharacterized membrane protein